MTRVLTLAEVAEALRVSPRTIQRWVIDGRFPRPVRPSGRNGRPRWPVADVDTYLAAGSMAAYKRQRKR